MVLVYSVGEGYSQTAAKTTSTHGILFVVCMDLQQQAAHIGANQLWTVVEALQVRACINSSLKRWRLSS